MEKPDENASRAQSTGRNVTDIVSRIAVDYMQLVVDGARVYQHEMERDTNIPFLLRNIKGIAKANARFLDGVAARIQIAGDIIHHNQLKGPIQEPIDYEKLAGMVAEKLKQFRMEQNQPPQSQPDQNG
jgi:hypothetical protein